MLKIKYDVENAHGLTSQGAEIKQDINIRTDWTPGLGVLNALGELLVVAQFVCWYSAVYKPVMSPPRMQIDQIEMGKFNVFVADRQTSKTSAFAVNEEFVFEFSKTYIVENYGIDPDLIEYLPM